jgi:hypothetical protein
MPSWTQLLLIVVLTGAYGFYYWKYRLPRSIEPWRPSVSSALLVWLAFGYESGDIVNRISGDRLPLILCSFSAPILYVAISAIRWAVRRLVAHHFPPPGFDVIPNSEGSNQ